MVLFWRDFLQNLGEDEVDWEAVKYGYEPKYGKVRRQELATAIDELFPEETHGDDEAEDAESGKPKSKRRRKKTAWTNTGQRQYTISCCMSVTERSLHSIGARSLTGSLGGKKDCHPRVLSVVRISHMMPNRTE